MLWTFPREFSVLFVFHFFQASRPYPREMTGTEDTELS